MRKHKKTRTTQLLTMDELHARPCEVDGRPALFHRWIEEDRAILSVDGFYEKAHVEYMEHLFHDKGLAGPGCHMEVLRNTFALVEYRDGTIAKVLPEKIRFIGEEAKA